MSFSCSCCPKYFDTESQLNKHEKIRHNDQFLPKELQVHEKNQEQMSSKINELDGCGSLLVRVHQYEQSIWLAHVRDNQRHSQKKEKKKKQENDQLMNNQKDDKENTNDSNNGDVSLVANRLRNRLLELEGILTKLEDDMIAASGLKVSEEHQHQRQKQKQPREQPIGEDVIEKVNHLSCSCLEDNTQTETKTKETNERPTFRMMGNRLTAGNLSQIGANCSQSHKDVSLEAISEWDRDKREEKEEEEVEEEGRCSNRQRDWSTLCEMIKSITRQTILNELQSRVQLEQYKQLPIEVEVEVEVEAKNEEKEEEEEGKQKFAAELALEHLYQQKEGEGKEEKEDEEKEANKYESGQSSMLLVRRKPQKESQLDESIKWETSSERNKETASEWPQVTGGHHSLRADNRRLSSCSSDDVVPKAPSNSNSNSTDQDRDQDRDRDREQEFKLQGKEEQFNRRNSGSFGDGVVSVVGGGATNDVQLNSGHEIRHQLSGGQFSSWSSSVDGPKGCQSELKVVETVEVEVGVGVEVEEAGELASSKSNKSMRLKPASSGHFSGSSQLASSSCQLTATRIEGRSNSNCNTDSSSNSNSNSNSNDINIDIDNLVSGASETRKAASRIETRVAMAPGEAKAKAAAAFPLDRKPIEGEDKDNPGLKSNERPARVQPEASVASSASSSSSSASLPVVATTIDVSATAAAATGATAATATATATAATTTSIGEPTFPDSSDGKALAESIVAFTEAAASNASNGASAVAAAVSVQAKGHNNGSSNGASSAINCRSNSCSLAGPVQINNSNNNNNNNDCNVARASSSPSELTASTPAARAMVDAIEQEQQQQSDKQEHRSCERSIVCCSVLPSESTTTASTTTTTTASTPTSTTTTTMMFEDESSKEAQEEEEVAADVGKLETPDGQANDASSVLLSSSSSSLAKRKSFARKEKEEQEQEEGDEVKEAASYSSSSSSFSSLVEGPFNSTTKLSLSVAALIDPQSAIFIPTPKLKPPISAPASVSTIQLETEQFCCNSNAKESKQIVACPKETTTAATTTATTTTTTTETSKVFPQKSLACMNESSCIGQICDCCRCFHSKKETMQSVDRDNQTIPIPISISISDSFELSSRPLICSRSDEPIEGATGSMASEKFGQKCELDSQCGAIDQIGGSDKRPAGASLVNSNERPLEANPKDGHKQEDDEEDEKKEKKEGAPSGFVVAKRMKGKEKEKELHDDDDDEDDDDDGDDDDDDDESNQRQQQHLRSQPLALSKTNNSQPESFSQSKDQDNMSVTKPDAYSTSPSSSISSSLWPAPEDEKKQDGDASSAADEVKMSLGAKFVNQKPRLLKSILKSAVSNWRNDKSPQSSNSTEDNKKQFNDWNSNSSDKLKLKLKLKRLKQQKKTSFNCSI